MEDQSDRHITIRKKRSLSEDHYGIGIHPPSKRRALSEGGYSTEQGRGNCDMSGESMTAPCPFRLGIRHRNSGEEQRRDVTGLTAGEASSPQQTEAVSGPDVGSPRHTDAPLSPPSLPQHDIVHEKEHVDGVDRARFALGVLLVPSSSPSSAQSDDESQLPPPSSSQQSGSSGHRTSPTRTEESPKAKVKLPPMGKVKASSAALPAALPAGKSGRKRLPTLGQKTGGSGGLNAVEKPTKTSPKKRRQSQLLVSDERDGSQKGVARSKGKAPKRQREDDENLTDEKPDATQVDDSIYVLPVRKKRHQSRWTAVNSANLVVDDDEDVPQQQPEKSQEEKEEEEEQLQHDMAQRSLDYRATATPKRGRRRSSNNNGKKSGTVWAGMTEPLFREDKEHNRQLEEGRKRRRREREKQQAGGAGKETTPEEKRRIYNEKQRERRARIKREKEEEERRRQSGEDTLDTTLVIAVAS
ncbi:uncharacterized protein PG986_008322 [Apiospora aurea]|uniref:Uncharacterized protein n=1 Tax=Apiospora aurea TaxID=335848 RepID=A0ABR1QF30_9PEZI